MKKVTVGIIGCGAISPAYLSNLTTHFAPLVEVAACADIVPELAEQRAAAFGVPRACSTGELLADPGIELVVNLTFAPQHFAVSQAALQTGKHVFTEKPLAVEREEGRALLDLARQNGLLIAGAADIFLGAGLQACRRLLDEGAIGQPLLASALIALNYGSSQRWNSRGTGPVFDMGPYYLTALVALLGPVRQVSGMTATPVPRKQHPENTPEAGGWFDVTTPMEAGALLRFESGLLATFAAVGEAAEGYVPRLEIFGTRATLQASDPNMYLRPVILRGPDGGPVEVAGGFQHEGRGLGVAEMAWALRAGRQPRAGGELMYHVLDIMHAIHESSEQGRQVEITSGVPRPEPFDPLEMFAAFA
jgi:predicted dehydrogenase